MATTAEIGRRGEDVAAAYLEARGYRILDRNVRFLREEVDLVAFQPTARDDGGMIVFVEVKARSGGGFGRPEDAVDAAKQRAIMRVAEAYLHERRLIPSPTRFDVVAVHFGRGEPRVEHFENAFGYFV
ncbi:YraN family protein [Rubrivirga sp.]|uniref:YraN family protein n=1 Tax=Rubrivirga sp. TaxID=1885344 RepID=UPI003B521036